MEGSCSAWTAAAKCADAALVLIVPLPPPVVVWRPVSALAVVVRGDGIVLAADRSLSRNGVELAPGVPWPEPDAPKLFVTPGGLGVALVGKATAPNPGGAAVDLRTIAVDAVADLDDAEAAAVAVRQAWARVAGQVRTHAGGGSFPVPPWTSLALTVAVIVGAGEDGPAAALVGLPPTGRCWSGAVLESTSFAPEKAAAELGLVVVNADAAPSLAATTDAVVAGIRAAATSAPGFVSLDIDSVTVSGAETTQLVEHRYVRPDHPLGW